MGNFTPVTLVDDVNVLMVHFPPLSTLCTAISSTKLCKTAKCTDQQTVIFIKIFSLQNIDRVQLRQKIDYLNSSVSKQPNHHILLSNFTDSENLGLLYRPYINLSLRQKLIRPPFLSPEEKLWITFLLLKSVQQLHELGLIHSDIRPENLLITSWNWVFLADIGFYKPLSIPEGDLTTYNLFFAPGKREACYLAPERFDSKGDKSEINQAADIFALGCVIAEVLLDGEALLTMSEVLIIKKTNGKCQKLNMLGDDLKTLITNMICSKPQERWEIQKCLDFFSEKIVKNQDFNELYHFSVDLLKKNHVDDRVEMVENWLEQKLSKTKENLIRVKKSLSKVLKSEKTTLVNSVITFYHSIVLLDILTSCIRNVTCPSMKIRSAKLITHLPLPDEAKLHRVLPHLTYLLAKEERSNVKCAALSLIPELLASVGSLSSKDIHLFKECVWPPVSLCKNDESDYVRYTLAVMLPKYAMLARNLLEIGRVSCKVQTSFDRDIKSLGKLMGKVYREMLDKEDDNTQLILLSNFPHFVSHFGSDICKSIFKEAILPKVVKEHTLNPSQNPSETNEQVQIAILSECEKYIEILGSYFFSLMFRYLENNLFGKSETLVYLTLKVLNLNPRCNLDLLEKTLPYLLHPNKWIQKEMKKMLRLILHQLDPTANFLHLRPMVLPFLAPSARKVFVIEMDLIKNYLQEPLQRLKLCRNSEVFTVDGGQGALASLVSMIKFPKAKNKVLKEFVMPEERIYYEENYSSDMFFSAPSGRTSVRMQYFEGIGLSGELEHYIDSHKGCPVTHLMQTSENLIMSASNDGKVILWKFSKPDDYSKIKYKEKKETSDRIISLGNCGDFIFLAYSSFIKIWDEEFSQVEEQINIENLTQACELGPNLMLASDMSGNILQKDLRDPHLKKLFELGPQKGIISSILKTSDNTIALGSISGNLIIFDLRFNIPASCHYNSFKQPILTMANYSCKYKPIIDGDQLLMGLSNDIVMWDLLTMRPSVLFTQKSPVQVPFMSPEPFYYPEYQEGISNLSLDCSIKMQKLELHSKISKNFVNGLTEFGPLLKKSWENRSNVLKIKVPHESNLILSTGEDALVHVWDPVCVRNSCVIGNGMMMNPDYQSAIIPDLLVIQEQSLPPPPVSRKRRDFDNLNSSRKASHTHTINDLLFIQHPKPLLLTGSNDGSIRIWR